MKVCVTGGAGFIGSNLVDKLIEMGLNVAVLDDFSTGFRSNITESEGLTLVEGSVLDKKAVESAVGGCEVVFHLAASVGNKRSIDEPSADTAINVLGTLNVLEAMRKFQVGRIVTSSSAGVYGELRGSPINETHPLEPLTPYSVSKLYAERQSLAFALTYGFNAVCLRYFNVYGTNQRFDAYGNVIPIFVFNALAGRPITIFGDGSQTRDFIHVDDVVIANINAAFDFSGSGVFNIASGGALGIANLAQMVNNLVGQAVPINYVAPRIGDVMHSTADISAASNALGFFPKVLMSQGLKKYVRWAESVH